MKHFSHIGRALALVSGVAFALTRWRAVSGA